MADEFMCDTPQVRSFIAEVQHIAATSSSLGQRLTALRPSFSRVLADPDWLPAAFRRSVAEGGMGRGIANWLLYRDTAGTLSLSALVLPAGVSTPVHDHLAWGLVGLYVGEQEEVVYEIGTPAGGQDRQAVIKVTATNHLVQGSFYELVPPEGDIHRVTTIGEEPSISLHLLGNDVGCTWRHRFEPETGEIAPFRSGYTNRDCEGWEGWQGR